MAYNEADTLRKCLKLQINGVVQGVGFRPFIYLLATELGLTGWVENHARGVTIAVEGERRQLLLFQQRLQQEKPLRSQIYNIITEWDEPTNYQTFEVRESCDTTSEDSPAKTAIIPPDLATCAACLRDIFDARNRRARYPFTNCTNCGPRYSIIAGIPYDRRRTTMHAFSMCGACRTEYENPRDRRFHAQPNACPQCGPHLELWDGDRQIIGTGNVALLETVRAIRAGQIIAVKGLGGFHLVVDASNTAAVRKLRERKHRPHKPFALMYPNIRSIAKDCRISELEAELLQSPEAPIVLLQKSSNHKELDHIASDNPCVGIMLPYTPLHHLLMAELQFPIVATSGNLAGEPICIDNLDALARLGNIADLFLLHNRDIVQPIDDSVVRVMGDRPVMLRRARGYAPLPIRVSSLQFCPGSAKKILALGGHLKNTIAMTIAMTTNDGIVISQHIGDLETTGAFAHFQAVNERLSAAYEFRPDAIACDAHPDYLSSQYADRLSQSLQIPLIRVQHHYAHVLAGMADNDLQPPVLGVTWDGAGYGTDGTIWGGEFLAVADSDFERVAHLRYFPMLGGDRAAKEPRRSALGILWELFGDRLWDLDILPLQTFTTAELKIFQQVLQPGLLQPGPAAAKQQMIPQTSSMGRLFDAVASLLGICQVADFEGQAAIALENLCYTNTNQIEGETYKFDVDRCGEIDWAAPICAILADRHNQIPIGAIAVKFHLALVEAIAVIAQRIQIEQIVLTGGCFQNRYLTESAMQKLRQLGFQPYCHHQIPPNDGGLPVGQIIAAWNSIHIRYK